MLRKLPNRSFKPAEAGLAHNVNFPPKVTEDMTIEETQLALIDGQLFENGSDFNLFRPSRNGFSAPMMPTWNA